jgi:toxin HigB-1
MIKSFADDATRDIFDGVNSKKARRKGLDSHLFLIARRKLDMIDVSIDLNDLRIPSSNHLEILTGDLKGKHSIRINNKYRIVFYWTNQGAEEVEIIDYHS